MESVDQQLLQLKENYESMTEDELCHVAEDAYDLTDIGREALQAVITECGFTVQLKLEPPAPPQSSVGTGLIDEPEDSEDPKFRLVWVRTVKSESEAKLLKALLDANFVASCLGPENIVDLEDFKGNFDGGVELKVHAFNSRRAFDALARFAPEEEEEDPDEDAEYAILCPKCHSAKVVLEGADIDLKKPPNTDKFQWSCDACGHQWVDDGMVQEVAGGQSWPREEFPAPSEEWDPK